MADIKLDFKLTLRDGTKEEQDVTVPADAAESMVVKTLMQYASVGMLKRDGNKFFLVCASEISRAEVEIPSILVANLNEIQANSKLIP